MKKEIKQSCTASLIFIAAEFVFSLILKSKAVPSPIVIGDAGAQSLVYFMPAVAGIILYLLIAFTAFLVNASFKAFAHGGGIKWLVYFAIWAIQAAAAVFSVVKISTMEFFSFENNILRIAQFVAVIFSVLSCVIVKRMKIS
ncbi:hypothetical protein [Ruminococcus sp. HUN007]|uniref:hypothetical protein n=1 Tax=Ruminococcus sp. HUN007 TaxID=1514668 RepID=UPI0005D2AA19|nr:hypothetical protein [Ruminococcus sp. HUN007]